MQSSQIAWGHFPELRAVVEDRGWEQREQDSSADREGEDSTEMALVKVYWSRTDMFTFLLTVWRQVYKFSCRSESSKC